MIKRRNGPERWLPKGGLKGLRETLTPTDEQRAILENLPAPKEGDFSVEFADSVAQREIDLAREADAVAKAAAAKARETPLERHVLASILKTLRQRGHAVHRMTSGVFDKGPHTIRTGEPGMPDLLVELGTPAAPSDRMLWIEVKRPGQKPRENQVRWMENARRRGQRCGVATSAAEAIALVEEALGA